MIGSCARRIAGIVTCAGTATLRPVLSLLRRLDALSRSSGIAVLTLVVANAVPLFGVLFLGWDILTLLVLYWIESGVIGLFNILKMARAESPGDPTRGGGITFRGSLGADTSAGKGCAIPFFAFHYGLFWVVHGVFVFLLPLFAGLFSLFSLDGPLGGDVAGGRISATAISVEGMLLAALALTVSHAISFYLNFLGRREYRHVSVMSQMARPYGRVVVLHLTIILGGILVAVLGQPIALLVLLVVLKTALDLLLHLRSHRAAPEALPPSGAQP